MTDTLPGTKYEVSAWLRLRGNFDPQVKAATSGLSRMNSTLSSMSRAAERAGQRMVGVFRGVADMGKMATLAMAGGGAAAGALFFRSGFQFSSEMANARLNIGSMFQLFGQAQSTLGNSVTQAQAWRINMELAERTMARFLVLQRDTPAGAAQLSMMYQSAASALSQTGEGLEAQAQLITQLSLLGPALQNDFGQLGRDLARMLEGGAGLDVRTWVILRQNIANAAVDLGFVKRQVAQSSKFTEVWNSELLAGSQRVAAVRKAMEGLGPAVRETFGQSLAGLETTSASNVKLIQKGFADPIRESYRQFLLQANSRGSGIFGEAAMKRWSAIFSRYGNIVASTADVWFDRIEKAANVLSKNWSVIGDHIKSGFQAGVALVKVLLAKAVFDAMTGPILLLIGKISSHADGQTVSSRAREGVQAFASRRMVMHRRMARGLLGAKGGGLSGMFGRSIGSTIGRGDVVSGFRQFEKMLLRLGSLFGAAAMAALPVIAVFGGLAAMVGVVGVTIGGMSAFIIENWEKISSQIMGSMHLIRPAIEDVVVAGLRLWFGLVAVGEAFLGSGNSVTMLTNTLGILESVIKGIAATVVVFVDIGAAMRKVVGVLQHAIGGLLMMVAQVVDVVPGMGSTSESIRIMSAAFADSAAESFAGALEMSKASARFEEIQASGAPAITKAIVDMQVEKMTKGLTDVLDRASGGNPNLKKPRSGIHVENLHQNVDLRGEDPDRIIGVLEEQVERVTTKRVQPFNQLDQGV